MDELEKRILESAAKLLDIVEVELLKVAAKRGDIELEEVRYDRYNMLMGLARARGLIRDATLPEDERLWKGNLR